MVYLVHSTFFKWKDNYSKSQSNNYDQNYNHLNYNTVSVLHAGLGCGEGAPGTHTL